MKVERVIDTKSRAGFIAGLLLLCIAISPIVARSQSVITTYAGGSPIQLSSALSITQIGIGSPASVISDGAGGFYFTTSQRVYRAAAGGSLTLIAGNGTTSFSGDGGPAVFAGLNYPMGIATDAAGNMFIADHNNYRIRKVGVTGVITTVAGTGSYGSTGDGGPAIAAQLRDPSSIAVDGEGNLFIAEDFRIRKVTPAGIITTVAGNGTYGFTGDGGPATSAQLYASSIAVDREGSLFIVDWSRIRKVTAAGIITSVAGNGTGGFSGDGGPATSAQIYQVPSSVTVDPDGNLFIGDNGRIRKVSPAGIITTIAGNGTSGFSGDGGPAVSAQMGDYVRVASDGVGNLFIADVNNNRIRKITTTGDIITVAGNGSQAGDGSPAISAQFLNPSGVAVYQYGSLLITDTANNRLARISTSGIATIVAGNGPYLYDEDNGDGGLAVDANLAYPTSLTVDAAGNVFIIASDPNDGAGLRQINAAGNISSIPPPKGYWYFFDYDGLAPQGEVCIAGLAVDAQGNLYVAETVRQTIWKITPDGVITIVAGSGVGSSGFSGDGGPATSALLSFPNGLAFDRDGNLFIADSNNNRIRKVTPAGIISTVAGNGVKGFGGDGGPATSAQLRYPLGVAVDADGNLFIADAHNNRIRKVTPSGIISTVAGDGTAGFGGDGGPADAAQLNYPTSIALDGMGHLFIADYYNNRIREVSLGTTLALTSISPGSGGQGKVVHVTLNGFHFDSSLSIGPIDGVTVSDLALVSSTSATATFTIAADAIAGLRNIVVTTSTGTNSSPFVVNPPPSITSLDPPVGLPGTSLLVKLAGNGFDRGLTVDTGNGVTVSNIIVISATSAVATFTVASNAEIGARSVTVTTLDGISVPIEAFSVVLPFPDLAITSVHATSFGVGFTETYNIRVTNVGLIATTGAITITDVLPSGLSFVSESGSAWSCAAAAQTVTCFSSGPLAAGATASLVLNVDVSSAAAPAVTHILSVRTAGDLVPSNNSASDATTVAAIPVPDFNIFLSSNNSIVTPVSSGKQSILRLTLATPFPHDLSGSITMGFISNVAIPVDDPAIQFASGGRQTTFSIPANSLDARFDGKAGPIGFQSGTVAGTLTFSGTLQAGAVQTIIEPSSGLASRLTLSRQRPVIQSLETSTKNGFTVSINLFSTTREISQFSLTFSTTTPVTLSCGSVSGCSASGPTLTFDAKSMFDSWFNSNTAFGSLSTLHLPLSISGTVHGTVLIRFQNSMGVSTPSPFTLP